MLFDPRDTDVISAAIFDEAQRGSGRDRLRNALAATTGTDPAEEALRQRLSKRLGVSVVDTKPAQQMADTDDIVSAIRAESATGRWLSQPENAAVARKDYTRLQALEEAYRRTRLIRDPAEREQRRADVANELMGMAGPGSYFASQGRSLLSGGAGIAAVPYDMVDVVGGAMGLGKEAVDAVAFAGTTPQASAIMSVSGAASAKAKQLREGMRVTFNGDRGRIEYHEFVGSHMNRAVRPKDFKLEDYRPGGRLQRQIQHLGHFRGRRRFRRQGGQFRLEANILTLKLER